LQPLTMAADMLRRASTAASLSFRSYSLTSATSRQSQVSQALLRVRVYYLSEGCHLQKNVAGSLQTIK